MPGLELSQIGDFRWNENPPDSMNSSLVQTRADACGADSKERREGEFRRAVGPVHQPPSQRVHGCGALVQ
ncbi:MAG: hypothetical protein CL719_07565 [Chloroflexi bacterium]|nr:hypothetical protein [Chloroflexota bacterium]